MIPWQQYPGEDLDYLVDFTKQLAGDTIESATVVASDGVVADRVSATTTAVVFWLTGGTPGALASIVCTVATAGKRTLEAKPQLNLLQ